MILIVTGWGHYNRATAAAVAVRYCQRQRDNYKIFAKSKEELPKFLLNLSADSVEMDNCEKIFVLGIDVPQDDEGQVMLTEALSRLPDRLRPTYICDNAFGYARCSQANAYSSLMTVVPAHGDLTKSLAEYFDMAEEAANLVALSKQISSAHGGLPAPAVQDICTAIEAANFHHRNFYDDEPYIRIVEMLARDESLANDMKLGNAYDQYLRLGPFEIRGKGERVRRLKESIQLFAAAEGNVLILGPNGCGKELVAQNLHCLSDRFRQPFIVFNCACASPGTIISQLFGHMKGSFTGAVEDSPGLFRKAKGGTLFLDEIGELPLEIQGMLLRVLSSKKAAPLGGEGEEYDVDIRLVAATNRNLPMMVRNGEFREDLFHRLNVLTLQVPALKDHKEDIKDIAGSYMYKFKSYAQLSKEEIAALQDYDYPGNIRELLAILDRAYALKTHDYAALIREQREMLQDCYGDGRDDAKTAAPVPVLTPPDATPRAKILTLDQVISAHVKSAFASCGKNLSKTARVLDCSINTARKWLYYGGTSGKEKK